MHVVQAIFHWLFHYFVFIPLDTVWFLAKHEWHEWNYVLRWGLFVALVFPGAIKNERELVLERRAERERIKARDKRWAELDRRALEGENLLFSGEDLS